MQCLWETYRKQNLVVLAVPSNDFGAQEPWPEKKVQEFYTKKFNVDFPVTGKQAIVSPDDRHEFYDELEHTWGDNLIPTWNFHKFLIARDGQLVGSWSPDTSPLDPAVTAAIEKALKE